MTLYVYAPLIVEVVDGELVIVYPVHGEACDALGNPEEGLVALRFRKGEWQRSPLSILPAETRANISPRAKHAPAEPFEGEPLADLVKESQSGEYSCLSRIESRKQAQKAVDFQAGYSSSVSTITLPGPFSEEVQDIRPNTFEIPPTFDHQSQSGCEGIRVDRQAVGR